MIRSTRSSDRTAGTAGFRLRRSLRGPFRAEVTAGVLDNDLAPPPGATFSVGAAVVDRYVRARFD